MAKQLVKSLHSREYDELLAILKEAREAAGLSQHRLSRLLEQGKNYIGKIEAAERRLDVVEFMLIARALKLDPIALFARLVERSK